MPAKKNSPTKTKPTAASKATVGDKHRKGTGKKRGGSAVTDRRPSRAPSVRNKREQEIEDDLALTFLTEYQAFEQALVRAGFTRPGRIPGSVQVDWERFARHIERHFRPDSSVELQGAVAYLLYEKCNQELRLTRLQHPLPWEIVSPLSDLVWLSELVQQTRNELMLGFQFPETSSLKMARVLAALLVVEGMAYTDPQLECLLNSVL
jgi:hypothetical protein